MVRVLVEVKGQTYPHRETLRKKYNLNWDQQRKQFYGQLLENSPRLTALTQFCERYNLRIAVEGTYLEIDNILEVETNISEEGGKNNRRYWKNWFGIIT